MGIGSGVFRCVAHAHYQVSSPATGRRHPTRQIACGQSGSAPRRRELTRGAVVEAPPGNCVAPRQSDASGHMPAWRDGGLRAAVRQSQHLPGAELLVMVEVTNAGIAAQSLRDAWPAPWLLLLWLIQRCVQMQSLAAAGDREVTNVSAKVRSRARHLVGWAIIRPCLGPGQTPNALPGPDLAH